MFNPVFIKVPKTHTDVRLLSFPVLKLKTKYICFVYGKCFFMTGCSAASWLYNFNVGPKDSFLTMSIHVHSRDAGCQSCLSMTSLLIFCNHINGLDHLYLRVINNTLL